MRLGNSPWAFLVYDGLISIMIGTEIIYREADRR